MTHDVFDVYQTIIKDTNEMNARRRQLDSLYLSLITLILTGDAYVAFFSAFDNWLLVAVTIGISAVGWAITSRWREGLSDLEAILQFRYGYLRGLEQNAEMQAISATLYGQELKEIYEKRHANKRFRSVTSRLQVTFLTVFILIPLLLAALTAVETIPLVHSVIPAQIFPLIRPLALPSRP